MKFMLFRMSFVILVLMTTQIFTQDAPTLETGVSQTLAKWRAANYSDVRYKLNLTLEKGAPLMKGEMEVRVKLSDAGAKNDLILDWRATAFENDKDKPFAKVTAVNEKPASESNGGSTFDYQTNKEHLIVSRRFLKAGENVVKIQFASPIKTSGAAVTRYVDKEDGAEYVYSLFVPSDASTAFPVFDQPDLKARFLLEVTAPNNWQIVSNATYKSDDSPIVWLNERTAIIGKASLPKNHKENSKKGLLTTEFEETKPISTYVFAFAAGQFQTYVSPETIGKDKLPSTIYVRQSQSKKMNDHLIDVMELNENAVKYLESYFDYKFPFPKYDLVLIPEFPFGGMEHAGATFLRESSIIFPSEPTKNDFVSRANLIFHEAAHQWFGDTVTMRWFDDLWLKEGFAEFMAYKTLERVMPEYNAWKIFYERNKQLAYLTDATRGTTPIYQEIPNLSAAKSAYGNIVYRKAPSFLKQAEFYLGADKFQSAVRAFLKKHEFANAEWTDLVKEFETASKQDLKDWANVWVKQRGLSVISKIIAREQGAQNFCCYYSFFQKNLLGDNAVWKTKLKVLAITINNNNLKEESRNVWDLEFAGKDNWGNLIDGKSFGYFVEPAGALSYRVYIPNYQDYGYGIFLLDEESRAYVLENIQTEKDDFLRAMMWGSLWDSVREAELAPRDYVRLVIKNISVEQDESTIQTLLNRVSTAMNYYLSDKQQAELAPQIETLLIDKMQNAPTLGQRITFYRAFLNVASTDKAKQTLKDVLNSKFQITDFKLKTKDRFDIVTRLAVLKDADAPRLLADLRKTETSDEAKRYAYAAQAGFPSAENAARYFNDFTNNRDISESYIESAFVPFNAVRNADLTLPYLEKALAELPNLKKNRKIFFVNGWLAAFIGGQKSEQALQIVNKFLSENPNLDKDLRLKILEASDNLERSIKIRKKFLQ